ncbi:hypothetical protein F5Y04DRAFT_91353 [Hypomontagnella monticulosa]|nr:hypothetical protein F5Y04DRAFT_91353 [Hypomontagnella monticulosa]
MLSTSRRAHHKSRAGCTTCKAKKVKCDEKQPCSYCVKRQLQCSLAPSLSPRTEGGSGSGSRTPEITAQSTKTPLFAFTDFGLYRHFTKSTALAHADDSASVTVWLETIPDLAIQYPYLLHLILALAALHMRSTAPEQTKFLERIADEHQAKAIPLFREALATSSAETVLPLFACSCLFVPYYFAAAKDASSLLFNEETGLLAEWLVLIQGCAAITVQHNATIMRSPLRVILGDLHTPKVEDFSNGPTDARLVHLEEELPIAPEHREAYAQVMVHLRLCFYLSDGADTPLNRKNAALRFPPLMGKRFREHLAGKHPAALIIMAYWCVLLHRVEDRWWLKERVEPLLLKIEELVPREYTSLMSWPLEEVGISSKAD